MPVASGEPRRGGVAWPHCRVNNDSHRGWWARWAGTDRAKRVSRPWGFRRASAAGPAAGGGGDMAPILGLPSETFLCFSIQV